MLKLSQKSPLPFYRQIEDWFRMEIAERRLTPNELIPDERELARRLGLSRMTVRRAIMALAGDGLLYRIRGRGTFVTGAKPGVNAPTRIATVAVVAPFDQAELRQSFFYYRIMEGLQSATQDYGLALTHCGIKAQAASIATLKLQAEVRAILVLGIIDPQVLQFLARLKLPLLLVDSAQPPQPLPARHRQSARKKPDVYDSITHISEDSVFRATSHLLNMGHRNIAFLSFGPSGPTPASLERETGFMRALSGWDNTDRVARVIRIDCNATAAYATVRRLLSDGAAPTGLICATDEIAMGAVSAIKDHGWRVPQDVSVVGYGDLGYFSQPVLSTIRIPLAEMGRKAAEFLRARLDRPGLPAMHAAFPTEFIARASSDIPRGSQPS